MRRVWLRSLIQRCGSTGIFLVGSCLLLRHLWRKQRLAFIGTLAAICAAGLWLWPRHPHTYSPRPAPLHATPLRLPSHRETSAVLKERPLLKVATQVTDMRRLYQAWFQTSGHYDFRWLSNDEVLVFQSVAEHLGESFLWIRYNLKTGSKQPLTRLSQRFNATHSFLTWSDLSLDGKWLLWQGDDDTPIGDGIHSPVYGSYEYASTLDGARFVRWPPASGPKWWAADNRHWISLPTNGFWLKQGKDVRQVMVCDTETPNETITIPFDEPNALTDIPGDQGNLEGFLYSPALFVADNILILRTWGQLTDRKVELRDVNLYASAKPAQRHFLQLPMAAFIKSAIYSPQSDRIAWLLIDREATPFAKIGLYICQADGSDMKEIGLLKVPSAPFNQMGPENLCWLPDGRHLSFVYKDALWTVPAD